MKCTMRRTATKFFVTASIVFCGLSLLTIPASAQYSGQDAVYSSSGGDTPAPDFIDASVFAGAGTTFCTTIYGILSGTSTTYPSTGAVIDARGLNSNNTTMTCASGTSPWWNGTTALTAVPSTILLPAGTIGIAYTWILPPNTHLVGEGDATPSPGTPGTTIQLSSSVTAPMIQFGSTSACSGISVERLTLDGQATATDGIVNQYCQTPSYVDHVTLYQILGMGLSVSNSADNSGPYSHITFDTGGYSGLSSTVCAQIKNVSGGTQGIHGLYCKSETHDATAAVLLDSSNNSIEDVTVVGFTDGILIGSQAVAQNNILRNIVGDTDQGMLVAPINVVQISNSFTGTSDISIMGVANDSTSGSEYTVRDDQTSTFLSDSSIAIYALGEENSGGYSRYTTSPHAATWATGTSAPTSGSCTAAASGSLFSNTGGSGYAFWVCPATSSSTNWKSIM